MRLQFSHHNRVESRRRRESHWLPISQWK